MCANQGESRRNHAPELWTSRYALHRPGKTSSLASKSKSSWWPVFVFRVVSVLAAGCVDLWGNRGWRSRLPLLYYISLHHSRPFLHKETMQSCLCSLLFGQKRNLDATQPRSHSCSLMNLHPMITYAIATGCKMMYEILRETGGSLVMQRCESA